MHKKGILLTLSFVTLAAILFSVAFLISYNENEAEQGVVEIITLDNLQLKNTYISNCIRDIIIQKNASIVSYSNNSVEFNIKNNQLQILKNNITQFTDFVKYINPDISFSEKLTSDLKFTLSPLDIEYSHPFSANNIEINLKNSSKGINIDIQINKSVYTDWTWETSTAGSFNVSAYIKGNDTNKYTTKNINLAGNSLVNISTGVGRISVWINNGKITIENGAKEGSIKTKIILNSTLDTAIIIPDVFNITTQNGKLIGDVYLAEK